MSEIVKVPISEVVENSENPRIIKRKQFETLVKSIQEFPEMLDVRPIVVNKEMVILGGNMRFKAAVEAGVLEIPVQMVDWSEEKQKEFIVKDNVSGGEWDWNLLANQYEIDQLDNWGIDVSNIEGRVDDMEDGDEIEFEQSVQVEPPKEYILVMAEPNSEEWEELKEFLQLKMVRRGGYKKGSAFDAAGLERVINWSDLKDRMGVHGNADSSTK